MSGYEERKTSSPSNILTQRKDRNAAEPKKKKSPGYKETKNSRSRSRSRSRGGKRHKTRRKVHRRKTQSKK